jgi:radical SAM superfamily enzyme
MKILVTPTDLIERCIWYEYEFYILKDLPLDERKKIVKENLEFEITEKDAFTIGLLKIIHTDNLEHKFNEFIDNILKNKSFEHSVADTRKFINRELIINEISRFIKKFPNAYEPNPFWKQKISEVEIYIEEIKSKIEKMTVIKIQEYDMLSSNSIHKILKHF